MIGLKRGTVKMCPHDPAWASEAQKTIQTLRRIFGPAAVDIQHVGSTAIADIYAKPIIDIAAAVRTFDDVCPLIPELEAAGFFHRPCPQENQMLFSCGSYYTGGDLQTHFIHITLADSEQWQNYISFRDYMNAFPEERRSYERLKLASASAHPSDRGAYTSSKHDFIAAALRRARAFKGSALETRRGAAPDSAIF